MAIDPGGRFRAMQNALMDDPSGGDVIQGTGGLRKLRWTDKRRGVTEGFVALADQRTGKRTLRTHVVQTKATPKMSAKELSALRERMNLSRALFAKYLRTNVRTLENWEQGRARPNAQAALLIRMVERYPDTVERLAKI
jgi:putative transcriptional regulator